MEDIATEIDITTKANQKLIQKALKLINKIRWKKIPDIFRNFSFTVSSWIFCSLRIENSQYNDMLKAVTKASLNNSSSAIPVPETRHEQRMSQLQNEIACKNQYISNLHQQVNFYTSERTKLYRDIYFLQQQIYTKDNQGLMLERMSSMESEMKGLQSAVQEKKME